MGNKNPILENPGIEAMVSNGLSQRQAEVQALRLQEIPQKQIADILDMELGTVKSHCHRVDGKLDEGVRILPEISKIEYPARVGERKRPAVIIWFQNDTALRYVWYDEKGSILEETVYKGIVHDSYDVGGDRDQLEEYALMTVAEYINEYRDNVDALRRDWPAVFEGITGITPA